MLHMYFTLKDEFNTEDTVEATVSPVPQSERRAEIKLLAFLALTLDGDDLPDERDRYALGRG
jgi:hypothetical protein